MAKWRPIDTAPKDGSEILGWHERSGILVIRWTSCYEFMTDTECEKSGMDDAQLASEDWFYADFVEGGRLEGSEVPTMWMPMPDEPVPLAQPDYGFTPLERWELYRKEMMSYETSIAKIAGNFLAIGCFDDAAKTAAKAGAIKHFIGRMPDLPATQPDGGEQA